MSEKMKQFQGVTKLIKFSLEFFFKVLCLKFNKFVKIFLKKIEFPSSVQAPINLQQLTSKGKLKLINERSEGALNNSNN
jgi:hypothetical protein